MKDKEKLLWGSIFLLAIFLRLFMLDQVPYGIHVDEVGMAYDAYWLAKDGVDRWSMSYPIYLLNYGSGQSAMYAYCVAVLVKLTGVMNEWVIRFPAVIFGMMTLWFGKQILEELWGKREAFLGTLLMAVCPYFIIASRVGLDCDLFLGLTTLSLYLLLYAVKKQKPWLYAAAGIGFGLSLYTYVLSYLILPLFLGLAVIYLLYLKRIRLKELLALGIPLGVLAAPLMAMILLNQLGMESMVIGPFTIPKMLQYRAGEFGVFVSFERIRELFLMLFWHDGEYSSSFPGFGTLFLWSVPLAFLGLAATIKDCICSLRKRNWNGQMLILFFMLAQLVVFCMIDEIYTYKLNGMFFGLVCWVVQGIHVIAGIFAEDRVKHWWRGIAVLYLATGIIFSGMYFSDWGNASYAKGWYFSEPYEQAWNATFEEIADKTIYTELNVAYFLYSTRIHPSEITGSLLEGGLTFRNLKFYLGSQYRENAAYIVCNDNVKYQEQLKEWGYTMRYQDEWNSVWY